LKFVEGRAKDALRQLAVESYEESKLRYYQGAFKALELVYKEYPSRLLKNIREEIDK